MTPAPHQIKIEHDGRLYLRWSRSSLDDAVEYVCDVKKGMFLHGNYTGASDVLDELIIHFKGFEDQKTFKYSAGDIIQYLENFKKLTELRQQKERE